MSKLYKFIDKETYDRVAKYLGEPPCGACFVQPMCFDAEVSNKTELYEILLKKPCDEAIEWFGYGQGLGNGIDIDWSSFERDDLKKRIRTGCHALGFDCLK